MHVKILLYCTSLGCKVPKKIDSLQGKGVIKLLCGSQFSIALTNQGHLYTWCVCVCLFACLSAVCMLCVCACAYVCCVCHTFTQSKPLNTHRGKGDYHRLGHGDDGHQRTPKRVLGALENEKVIDMACGSLHCVVCTASGKVYAWGDNDEGQIGNNSTTSVHSPHVSVTH